VKLTENQKPCFFIEIYSNPTPDWHTKRNVVALWSTIRCVCLRLRFGQLTSIVESNWPIQISLDQCINTYLRKFYLFNWRWDDFMISFHEHWWNKKAYSLAGICGHAEVIQDNTRMKKSIKRKENIYFQMESKFSCFNH
jgi:hypothetical protein